MSQTPVPTGATLPSTRAEDGVRRSSTAPLSVASVRNWEAVSKDICAVGSGGGGLLYLVVVYVTAGDGVALVRNCEAVIEGHLHVGDG